MKANQNLIVSIICFGIILYHSIVNSSVITHPYMVGMIILLLGVGSYHLGCALRKIKNGVW